MGGRGFKSRNELRWDNSNNNGRGNSDNNGRVLNEYTINTLIWVGQ